MRGHRARAGSSLSPVCLAVLLRREHEPKQLVVVPCEFLSLYADSAEERLVEPEHVDDDVPEHREILRAFFRRETDRLRRKYGYEEYSGEPLEFHDSGMVTFALLGLAAPKEAKLAFDPDRRKRRAMYKEVCEVFGDYSVYIGGSTSFDFAGKADNKYDAAVRWAAARGFGPDDIVFIGDDFADGGGDSHARLGGLDRIVINDYRNFASAVGVLLN